MASQCGLLDGIYLAVVLHVLLLLVLIEQHVLALSLLLSYCIALPLPKLNQPTQPYLSSSTLSTPPLAAHACREGEENEWAAGTSATAAAPRHFHGDSLRNNAIVHRRGGALQQKQPSRTRPYTPTPEREAEMTIVATDEPSCVDGRSRGEYPVDAAAFADASVEEATVDGVTATSTSSNREDTTITRNSTARHPDAATVASALNAGWVWATAVVTLLSVCASVVLWVFASRCSTKNVDGTACNAAPWTYSTIPRIFLSLFTGIHVEQDGIRRGDFFLTVVALSVVGSCSIGQALCAALLRCRRSSASHRRSCTSRLGHKVGVLLVQCLTFAPLSILWISVAGIGQGNVLGCVYVLIAILLLLCYPRCVLSWRRRCWLVYFDVLLFMWTAQACISFPWVRALLQKDGAADASSFNSVDSEVGLSRRRRFLIVLGLLNSQNQTASSAFRLQIVHAVGVWWAGVEYFCFHTPAYAAIVARSETRSAWQAAGYYRARYLRALAVKEEQQRTRALALERAAHRKVEELRLEREGVAEAAAAAGAKVGSGSRPGHRGDGAFAGHRAASCADHHNAKPLNGHNPNTDFTAINAEGAASYRKDYFHARRHAPFGSCGSLRCLIEDGPAAPLSAAAAATDGSPASLSAALARSLDGWSSVRASLPNSRGGSWRGSNSNSGSRYESEDQPDARAPLLSGSATALQRDDAARRSLLRQNCFTINPIRRAFVKENENAIVTESPCPSATAATAKLGNTDVIARNTQAARQNNNSDNKDDEDNCNSYDNKSDPECPPPRGNWQWGREPTRSPAHAESDNDDNSPADHSIHLLNTSPFTSPALQLEYQKPFVAAVASAAPRLNLRDLSSAAPSFTEGARRRRQQRHCCGVQHEMHRPVYSSSPFSTSPAERSIAGWSVSNPPSPPAVDITALPSGRAADDAAVYVAPPPVEKSESVRIESSADQCRRPGPSGVRKLCTKLLKEAKDYLTKHTVFLAASTKGGDEVATIEACDANPQGSRSQRVRGSSAAPSAAPPPPAAGGENTPHYGARNPGSTTTNLVSEKPLRCLLVDYVLQHWVWVCALLLLLHFTLASTAVNLAPSLAVLAYGLLPRPWPPRWCVRAGVLYAAAALLAKCLLHALLATGAVSTASWFTLRTLSAVVLRLSFTVAINSSSYSESTVLIFAWPTWVDLVMSVVVLYAMVLQWSLVYADQNLLGGTCGTRRAADLAAVIDVGLDASPTQSPRPPPENTPPSVATEQAGCLTRWTRHRRGAGADYYSLQLFFDFLSLVLFCWAYYVIAPGDTTPSQDNVLYAMQHNRLPGIFVATLLGLVVVLFVERVIYVLHATVAKYVAHLVLAVAYHALYLAWGVASVSRDDTAATTTTTTATASSSAYATPVVLLMTAKLASLWCGALQLRHGYPLHRSHDPFTVKTDVVHWFGHMVYRTVPFLLELRVLLDWSFSATALKVQQWMLLEDIHHNVYRRYVDMHDLHWTSRHQGRRFPHYVRVYQGMLSFAAILLVLFFPLFWYSTFGPQVHASRVTAWTTEVAFDGLLSLPVFTADAALSSTSFRAAATTAIGDATPNPSALLQDASARDTWQLAQPSQCSSQMWTYTPAALAQLITALRVGVNAEATAQQSTASRATLHMRSRVTRSRATESNYATCSFEESYQLSSTAAAAIVQIFESWQSADDKGYATSTTARTTTDIEALQHLSTAIALPSFYTPYVVSSGSAVAAMTSTAITKVDCTLTLYRVGQYRGFSCLSCSPATVNTTTTTTAAAALNAAALHSDPGSSSSVLQAAVVESSDSTPANAHTLLYVVASSDVTTVQSSLSLIPNVGIIALYTSFILVISTYIRNFFAGDAHRVVLLQLANPEPVAELLRYIYLIRSSASNGQVDDLWLEQLLFLELLDLLRSPDRLLALGGRRVDDYVQKEYREDLYAVTKRPFDLRYG